METFSSRRHNADQGQLAQECKRGRFTDAITPDKILLIASAPSYSQGTIDPIFEIGKIEREQDLSFHLDAGVAGILAILNYYGGRALRECAEIVKVATHINLDAIKTLVSAATQSPDSAAAFGQLAAQAGLVGFELPCEMTFINEVLDALPDELRNVFLVNYFNDLYV